MYNVRVGRRHGLAALGLLAIGGSGCALDTRDLDAFRETATGPEKLYAIVADGTRAHALRAEAALRLLDLTRRDVDGPALLLEALTALGRDARRAILPTFERGLSARMQTEPGTAPTASAVRAKDMGVRLLPMLAAPERMQLGSALVRWLGADLERRADCGEFALEEIAAQVGAAGATASVDSLQPTIAPQPLARAAHAIAQHANPATRALAAAHLVEIERAYRRAPERHPALVAYALPALGVFADVASARQRLAAIAADSAAELAERKLALELLRSRTTQTELPQLAPIALDQAAPLPLRELALARVGETRAPEALPTLLALSSSDVRDLRQPATELAIELGGERALRVILASLPQKWNATYAKSELEAYAAQVARLAVTSSLTGLLGSKLYSVFFWNRVIAIRYLAERATPLEATWRLRLHVDDAQAILGEGWPDHWTIGQEAREALRVVAARQ